MKVLLYFVIAIFLSGCVPGPGKHLPRPDQLHFAPLEFRFPEVAVEQLDNGARLYLKEDHELPLVNLTLMVEGGSISDPLDKTGLSSLFAQALATGGAGNLGPDQLEAELEAMAASFSVSANLYSYEINLSLQKEDLDRGFDILADLLRAPRFDRDRIELARQQMLESIHRRNDEPGGIAARLLDETLAAGHPLGSSPTDETVSAITRADLVALHERYFHPANFWFAVSGDVDRDRLADRLEKVLGSWPQGDRWVRDFPTLPDSPPGHILLAEKDVPQTTILMGHAGISKDNPDQYALQVANFILGGGGFNSRLMREVRSNRGLAYSVYSYFQIGRYLPGFFIASSETKSESTAEVVSLMLTLIRQMREQPVTETELELAKQSLINSFVFAFENTHAIVARQVRIDYYDYPRDYLERYRQRISAVTVDDVLQVCRKYLHPDLLQVILVGRTSDFADQVVGLGLPVEKVDF